MKKNIFAVGVVAIAFAAAGIYFGTKRLEPVAPQASAVASLLTQSMVDTKGELQPLSKWKGKPLIVNFWATWCAPCVEEMPELSALQTEIAPNNVQIIGIGIDSTANIAQFTSKYKIAYPLYTGGMDATDISRQLGNQAGGLPFTVLIGRDGQVRKTYLGRLKMQELRKDLALL
jgi:thiol-disulfide isomerase/thioredoxin